MRGKFNTRKTVFKEKKARGRGGQTKGKLKENKPQGKVHPWTIQGKLKFQKYKTKRK